MMRLFSSLRVPTLFGAGAYCTFCFFSPRTTSQHLSLEIGRRSSIHTMSPTEYVLASSCAWYFFERRMVFFIVGCVKRRSTRTTTVFSCLSLTTTPCSVRFGISNLLFLRFRLGARLRLRGSLWFGSPGLLRGCRRSLGLRRGLRRTDALLRRNRLHTRDVAADDPHASRVLELTGGPLKAQIELLLLQLEYLVIELVDRHRSYVGNFHDITRRYVR